MNITELFTRLKNIQVKPKEHITKIGEHHFNVDVDGTARQLSIHEIRPSEPLLLNTLDSLVEYIKSKLDTDGAELYLHIGSHKFITLQSPLLIDGERKTFVEVVAPTPDNTVINNWNSSERFLIALNSQFVNDENRKDLIAFAGNVKEEDASQTSDDGFSQKTTVKRGISSVQDEIVPNPVILAPYRTFIEVKQPASEFIFRMQNGPQFGLFEADGGAWKLDAIKNIKKYLEDKLKEEINSGKITILA